MVVSIDFYQLLDKIDNVSIWIINAELSIYKRSQGYKRSRTNPASGKSWTWTRDRRIASPTRWQLGHAATNWSVRKWYSWINSGDRCNIWNIIDTSTILSTQGWINSIATSHSKMGWVFKVWTKPRWKRRQRGWNWHTFQPTSLSIFTANNGHNNYLKNWYRSCYNKISSNKNKP